MSKYKTRMAKELKDIGLSEIRDNFFRFKSNNRDIEFIVKTSWKFGFNSFLEIDFCVMSERAVDFSERGQFLFHSKLERRDKYVDIYDKCSIYFSLGRVAQWGTAPTLVMTHADWSSVISRASHDVSLYILPIFTEITTKNDLFDLLIEDTHCTSWMLTNRIRRILEIIYIANDIGVGTSDIMKSIRNHSTNIVKYFNPKISFDEFVEKSIKLAKTQSCL